MTCEICGGHIFVPDGILWNNKNLPKMWNSFAPNVLSVPVKTYQRPKSACATWSMFGANSFHCTLYQNLKIMFQKSIIVRIIYSGFFTLCESASDNSYIANCTLHYSPAWGGLTRADCGCSHLLGGAETCRYMRVVRARDKKILCGLLNVESMHVKVQWAGKKVSLS